MRAPPPLRYVSVYSSATSLIELINFLSPLYFQPQMIRYHGYVCEVHQVTTLDGYILTLHRIPHGKSNNGGGMPVFLQHGFIDSSATWIMNSPAESLGFMLADNG